jgi:hypothetical protein
MRDAGNRLRSAAQPGDRRAAADLNPVGRLGLRGEHGFHHRAPGGQPLVGLVAVSPAAGHGRGQNVADEVQPQRAGGFQRFGDRWQLGV